LKLGLTPRATGISGARQRLWVASGDQCFFGEGKMEKLDNLKRSVKKLLSAVEAADGPQPTAAQIETMIDAGCEAFADAVRLVKSIWREA
jgi:hypothetical protein